MQTRTAPQLLAALTLTTALTLALASCDNKEKSAAPTTNNETVAAKPQPKGPKITPPTGDFFDEDALFKDAEDPVKAVAKVVCAGAGEGDDKIFHPQKIRGTIFAPFKKFARTSPQPDVDTRPDWQRALEGGLDLLTSEALAHPLPQEKPIEDIEVRLMLVDKHGEYVSKEPILKTTSNVEGQYCFRVPDKYKIRPNLVAEVGEGATLMRRSIHSRSTNDIFAQPEAVFRILQREKIDFETLPRSEFSVLYSMTDTIVDAREDGLALPPGCTIKRAVELVGARLDASDRFKERLADVKKEFSVK